MVKFFSIFSMTLLLLTQQCLAQSQLEPISNLEARLEANDRISISHYYKRVGRYSLDRDSIPPFLLDRLVKLIEFALQDGSAREISKADLFHAHLLFFPPDEKNQSILWNDPDAILIHTQEYVWYPGNSWRRRSVLMERDRPPRVLPCKLSKQRKRYCSVGSDDIGMEETTPRIHFYPIDQIPDRLLVGYEGNIRMVADKKIVFGIAREISY